jgi:hypothetical protein
MCCTANTNLLETSTQVVARENQTQMMGIADDAVMHANLKHYAIGPKENSRPATVPQWQARHWTDPFEMF